MAILRFDEKHSHVPSFLFLSSNEGMEFMLYKVRGTRIIDKRLIFMSFRQDIRNKYRTQLRFTANDDSSQIHNFSYSTINRTLYVLSSRALKKFAIILPASLTRSRCHHQDRTSAPDRRTTYIYIFCTLKKYNVQRQSTYGESMKSEPMILSDSYRRQQAVGSRQFALEEIRWCMNVADTHPPTHTLPSASARYFARIVRVDRRRAFLARFLARTLTRRTRRYEDRQQYQQQQ